MAVKRAYIVLRIRSRPARGRDWRRYVGSDCAGRSSHECPGKGLRLFFGYEVARIGDYRRGHALEIWLQRVAHVRDRTVASDGREPDRQFPFELLSVEFHLFEDIAAVVEGSIRSSLTGISPRLGAEILGGMAPGL